MCYTENSYRFDKTFRKRMNHLFINLGSQFIKKLFVKQPLANTACLLIITTVFVEQPLPKPVRLLKTACIKTSENTSKTIGLYNLTINLNPQRVENGC